MYGNVCSGCKEFDPDLHVYEGLCEECLEQITEDLTFELYCGTHYSSVVEL